MTFNRIAIYITLNTSNDSDFVKLLKLLSIIIIIIMNYTHNYYYNYNGARYNIIVMYSKNNQAFEDCKQDHFFMSLNKISLFHCY